MSAAATSTPARTGTTPTGQSLLAGQWRDGNGPTFHGENPRTGQPTTEAYRDVDASQVDATAAAAAIALADESRRPSFDPAELLCAIANHLEQSAQRLITIADLETGLGETRLHSELARTTGQLRGFAAATASGRYLDPILDVPTHQAPARPDVRRVNVPLGPVAVWAASNFPLAFSIAGGDTASALAAGCPVIVKAHPSHPGTSELTALLVQDAVAQTGAPPAWFSFLQAHRTEPGLTLANHPAITALAFTGSRRAGRALFDAAASRPAPIPAYAELGSLNPLIITPGAAASRRDTIVTDLAASLAGGTGQFCTKPGLILTVAGPATGALLTGLRDALRHQPVGVMLNHRLRCAFTEQVTHTLQLAGVPAVEIPPQDMTTGYLQPPLLVEITSAVFRRHRELSEEHFGPFAVVVTCPDTDDLIAVLDELPASLTASLHSTPAEHDLARRALPALTARAGRVVHNGYPTGVPVGWASMHGGPYPATTAPQTSSVGLTAARRFQRPIAYQDLPDELLPAALQDANPLGLRRLVNGRPSRGPIRRHQP